MLRDLSIGVIGMGFVGGACIQGFSRLVPQQLKAVNSFDIDSSKNPTHNSLESLVKDSDIIFVGLPTPMRLSDGRCDVSIVEKVMLQLSLLPEIQKKIVVIKSTVAPGTTDRFIQEYGLRLVFNPEFLTEANWLHDFLHQDRVVLGGHTDDRDILIELYEALVPEAQFFLTTPIEAELIKYGANCFLSTKVSYFNELYRICEATRADYEKVRAGVSSDTRIGKSHTAVPGPDGHFGFGGTCFPKDLSEFREYAYALGIDPIMLDATWARNNRVRPEKDWEKMSGRAVVDS